MAPAIWNNVVGGFKPGRIRAMELLDIKETDRVLFVGEGSGLDFVCLPSTVDKKQVFAFDFSSQMVEKAKVEAVRCGIPRDNVFQGDAQQLPYTTEKFDKIYFPLSLGSIPAPKLALREAERVLATGGKIVIYEKLIDDNKTVSKARACMNLMTSCLFADVTRNLSRMLGKSSPLKITHYESLSGKLSGCFGSMLSGYYRLAVLNRGSDLPEQVTISATL